MELKEIFNKWAQATQKKYLDKQWFLSKWEVLEGIDWPPEKIDVMINGIVDELELKASDTLVELGCGGGWILKALRKYARRAFGLDISENMLHYAVDTCGREMLTCGEIAHLPFKAKSVSHFLCYFVFINIAEEGYLDRSIREIMRALKKGGRALIGQLPDINGSKDYDRDKAAYIEYCQKAFSTGDSIRDIYAPPIQLFDRAKISKFLKSQNIFCEFRDSFNPFYRPGQPGSVHWRFDIILKKE